MADAFTGSSTLDFSKAAYDRMAYFALRPELYFDAAADIQPTHQSMPGASVAFTIVIDRPIQASALTETTDVSTVALSDSQVTLTLAEYGNAVLTTAKLRGTSYVDIDPIVANVVGYNAGVSIDTIARAALDSGSNVMYGSGLGATTVGAAGATSRVTVGSSATLSSLEIRVARARPPLEVLIRCPIINRLAMKRRKQLDFRYRLCSTGNGMFAPLSADGVDPCRGFSSAGSVGSVRPCAGHGGERPAPANLFLFRGASHGRISSLPAQCGLLRFLVFQRLRHNPETAGGAGLRPPRAQPVSAHVPASRARRASGEREFARLSRPRDRAVEGRTYPGIGLRVF